MKLFKKLKNLGIKDHRLFGKNFKPKNGVFVFSLVAFSIFFISGLTYLNDFLSKKSVGAYTVEVAALPVNNNYFNSGYITPASCGVVLYTCGKDNNEACAAPVDYGHVEWGGACSYSPPAVPVTTLNISAVNVSYLTPVNLTWSSTNSAVGCTASGDWSGILAPAGGPVTTGNLSATRTYSLSCANAGGTSPVVSQTVTVCPAGTPTWNGSSCIGYPDLTADAATPATAVPGINNTLSAIIRNIGTASTNGSFSNFIQIASLPGGGGSIVDRPSSFMGTLTIGATSVTSNVYNFPGGPGTYSIRACADKTSSGGGGVIYEPNEGNNCGPTWTTVTVACTGTKRWDTINGICIDPQIVTTQITDQHYPPGDIRLTCNADTETYSVLKGGLPFIGPNQYIGPVILNDVVTESEQYTIKCIHGSVEDSTTILYDATIPPAVVKLIATDTSVDPPASTTIKWEVDYPTAACTLTAKVVCANNACTAAQLANEASINTILSTTNTDSNDPATSRPILNAIQSPAPGHKDSDTPVIIADYKALGRKTIPIKYTTDITYNCNGTKETKRIRVIRSEEQ